jgi:hypothetical protein
MPIHPQQVGFSWSEETVLTNTRGESMTVRPFAANFAGLREAGGQRIEECYRYYTLSGGILTELYQRPSPSFSVSNPNCSCAAWYRFSEMATPWNFMPGTIRMCFRLRLPHPHLRGKLPNNQTRPSRNLIVFRL